MSEQLYLNIGEQFAEQHETSISKMFGKSCLKTSNKKAFAAYHQEQMVFKLGKEEIKLLIDKYPGSQNWDPSGKGRAMKDWLQVPSEYSEEWTSLAEQAWDFVAN